jgi:type III pantothenate kinase
MILGIDIGNSNIVFGISENNEWLKVWRIQTDPMKTADEYEVIFRSLFASSHIANPDIRKVIISCVVPSLNRSFSEMIGQMLGFQPVFVGPDMYEKLPIQVLNPYEIGADLVVNATAAYSHYAHLCMVIDFGTALTFTTISETGAILGVANCSRTPNCHEIVGQ